MLRVRVTDRGHKTFFLYLRWPGARWAALREIGNEDRLPLEAAHRVAREWLAKVELGVDPHEVRRLTRSNGSLSSEQGTMPSRSSQGGGSPP
ncbi:DUF4102 domain-containing protein [Bradyrhizobium sp. 190]|uniref:integrase arm-type DNA-binding domain-containing protein n=1 Tax=Bradyrhizobium sp. 190 TaxID=2782658 RepID=UPI0035AB6E8E|nr:DUF4102 domain-containing protein [Bradyrhizobium sp. 190]